MSTALDFGVAVKNTLIHLESNDDNFFGAIESVIETWRDTQQNEDIIEGTIKNPFYIGTDNLRVLTIPDGELYTQFKRCIGICRKNGCKVSQFNLNLIFQKLLKQQDLEELKEYYTLIPVSIKLMKNHLHRQTSLILDRPIITLLNSSGFTLENTELVVPLFDIDEITARIYANMYEPSNDFTTLIASNVLYQYFDVNSCAYKAVILDRLSKMTNDLKESLYWTNPYYCAMNITDQFQQRTFKLKEPIDGNLKAIISPTQSGVQDKDIKNIFNKLESKTKITYDLQNIYRKPEFTDASMAIENVKQKYKLYKIDNFPLQITKEQVNDLFESVNDDKLLFHVFNSFLLSKTYCHFVLNNHHVLNKMQKFFTNKFLTVYNYIFSYAWVCMYIEECIVKTRTIKTNRYVFEINTANKLPFFPYCHENIHLNPYCALTVDEKVINSKENYHGLPMITDYKEYGIDNLEGFITKFNLFTTGKIDKNIFDGLETIDGANTRSVWKNFAISGSVIPACTQKRSPLVDQVTTPDMAYIDKIMRYFNEYYNESDIDLMCNSKSVFDYMDNIEKLVKVIKTNLNSLNNKDVSDTVTIDPIKTLCIVVHSKYIEEQMKEVGDLSYIVNNINTPAIKERFYEEYFGFKRDKNKHHRLTKKGNQLYEHFYKIVPIDDMNVMVTTFEINKDKQYEVDSDTYVYLNDLLPEDKKVTDDKNLLVLKISEGIKFKIRSSLMLHTIEAFRTRYEDFFSCVAKFHLPCVRGYYNNNNVYLLPSCVTALMTFTNIDYKYFAGIRDPIEIINKYRMRGFGTIINTQEKPFVTEYNSTIDKWKGVYNIDTKNSTSIATQFGPKKLNDALYKPGKQSRNLPEDSYKKVNVTYIMSVSDYYNYYKVNYGYVPNNVDFLKFKAYRDDGALEPLKKWVLDAAYDELK